MQDCIFIFRNPNAAGDETWPLFTTDNHAYLNIGETDTTAVDLFKDRMTFWNTNVPNVLKTCTESSHSGIIIGRK